jgi:Response regulator containing CheY-like receiver, AAA-type ATPase, and DNA-binding domains
MKLAILVLEDEPPVRTALARDLAEFAGTMRIEMAEDVNDAKEVIDEVTAEGDLVALILADHRLPGTTGVDFLIESMSDPRVSGAKHVLVTGQAGHAETIRAINQGHITHYVAKPWDAEELRGIVRSELTDYVLENEIPALELMSALDSERVLEALGHGVRGLIT